MHPKGESMIITCACNSPEHRLTLVANDDLHTLAILLTQHEAFANIILSEAQVVELANWLKSQLALWYFTRTASATTPTEEASDEIESA